MMADSIGGDIGTDGIVIPDVPQTALAFRTWRLGENGRLLSINAPHLTGKAGGTNTPQRRVSWFHTRLADAEGQDGWPIGRPLVAHCGVNPEHGRTFDDEDETRANKIPVKNCSCGIYATTSLKVINGYLGNEVVQGLMIRGPVLGVVEMGGSVIPAAQGFRAAYARVAAILAIDAAFSLTKGQLAIIAEFYRVPLLVPHSTDPEQYRDRLQEMPAVSDPSAIGDEIEEALKLLMEEGDDEE